MALTTVDGGMLSATNAQYTGFKNRIINGAMVIDQRNAGASITPANGQYSVDRWQCASTAASKFTAQQNAGSVTPPAGYINYLGLTSTSAYSVLSTDSLIILQRIEGLNTSDLAWGTANAATLTLSFWVRSSLTGLFSGSLTNSAANRAYAFSYTILAANTWEQKSITIVGDTSGTWLTTNGIGIALAFNLGTGSSYLGTTGVWNAGTTFGATGQVNIVGTSGATFYVTGVQLEKGSTATAFDYRPYGTELSLCQRYFQIYAGMTIEGYASGTQLRLTTMFPLPVEMRAAPTRTVVTAPTLINIRGNSTTYAGFAYTNPTTKIAYQSMESAAAGYMQYVNGTESLSAEL